MTFYRSVLFYPGIVSIIVYLLLIDNNPNSVGMNSSKNSGNRDEII
jgi:hypothetical protein